MNDKLIRRDALRCRDSSPTITGEETMKTEEFIKPKITFGQHLQFTPYAWAKLLWMRDQGDTEVAGYATTATNNPLLVTDFRLIKQKCTKASFELDPDDLIEDVEHTVNQGLAPWQTHNILCHTHPGDSPNPSGTDEDNFIEAFSHPDWAIMFIIANGGATYCRLKINVGPGVVKESQIAINWKHPFKGMDTHAWEEEYKAKVVKTKLSITKNEYKGPEDSIWWDKYSEEWMTQSEKFDCQNEKINDKCSDEIDCHWDIDGHVDYWDEESDTWFFYNPIKKEWYLEKMETDEEYGDIVKVTPPDKHWVEKVVLWSNKYANERNFATENIL